MPSGDNGGGSGGGLDSELGSGEGEIPLGGIAGGNEQ